MSRTSLAAIIVGLTVFSGVSRADLLSGCGTCQGSTYLLQYNTTTTTSGADTVYDVFLTIDTSGYTGGGSYIDNVLVKISNTVDLPPSEIDSAPGGVGQWTLTAGGLNSGGCQLGTDAGALCAQDGHSAPVSGGPTYTWEFDYATTGSIDTGTLASDIKVRYVDGSGNKVGALVSEGITLQSCTTDCGTITIQSTVPEPTSILMLGTVVLLVGGAVRRKFHRAR